MKKYGYLLAFPLAACASGQWTPTENAKISQSQADMECQMEAERNAPTHGNMGVMAAAAQQAKMYRLCMMSKGFQLLTSQQANALAEQRNAQIRAQSQGK